MAPLRHCLPMHDHPGSVISTALHPILHRDRAVRAQRFLRAVQADLARRARQAASREAAARAREQRVLTPEEQDRFVARLMEDARRRLRNREEIARKAELERTRVPAEAGMAALLRQRKHASDAGPGQAKRKARRRKVPHGGWRGGSAGRLATAEVSGRLSAQEELN